MSITRVYWIIYILSYFIIQVYIFVYIFIKLVIFILFWNWWVDCFIARSTEWCDILGVHSVLNILMYSIKHMHFVKLKKFGFSRTFLLKVIRRLFWVQSSEKQEKVTWIHFPFYPVFFFLSRRLGFLRSPLFLLITESISLDILINLVRGNIIVNANFFSVLKFEYYWNTATSKP